MKSYTALVKRFGSITAAAKSLNMPRTTFSDKLRQEKSDQHVVDAPKIVEQQQKELGELQARLGIYEALESSKSTYHIPQHVSRTGAAVPVAVLSDVHVGERVDPSDIPGAVNVYTPEVCRKRLEQFFQKTVYLNERIARSMAKVDTMVLALLGDLMTGHLHDDQKESNYLAPVEEILLLEEMISSGIEHLLSHGKLDKIIIPCTMGNHGRTSHKMRAKTLKETSFEWMLYKHLERVWAKEKRLEWHIAGGYHQYVKVFDTVMRFHHGDAIQYGGGVGGITIPIKKAIEQWQRVQRADLDIMGHFHQLIDGGNFIVNGSTIGYNAYSLRIKASCEPPQQAWFLIDQKRGKTVTSRIATDYMPPGLKSIDLMR